MGDRRQETGDNGDCRLHRTPYVAITIAMTMTNTFAIHRRRPKRARARAIAAPCPVLCLATRGRSGRLGTCTGCSFQAALCRPAAAACCLLPYRQPRALSASLLPPPRLQPEETEAEEETRHVVSLQRPAHGDKRSTAPHRTAQNRPQRADSIRQRRPVPPMASPSSSLCQPSAIALSPTVCHWNRVESRCLPLPSCSTTANLASKT
jgi:hypothetical protein